MNSTIGNIIRLLVVDSTNIYTSKKLSQFGMNEWTAVVADQQTLGKGQRGKQWHSQFGKNLLMSVYVKPRAIKHDHQFLISAASGLAIIKTLGEYGIEGKLKWPNDVLVGDAKICGLLIENQWEKNNLECSIIGIGLNVNQIEFNDYPWKATSMTKLKSQTFDLDEVLEKVIKNLKQLMAIAESKPAIVWTHYQLALYRLNQEIKFKTGDNVLEGILKGVNESGAIQIQTERELHSFVNGEVKLMRT